MALCKLNGNAKIEKPTNIKVGYCDTLGHGIDKTYHVRYKNGCRFIFIKLKYCTYHVKYQSILVVYCFLFA